jgi:hypothetical protein
VLRGVLFWDREGRDVTALPEDVGDEGPAATEVLVDHGETSRPSGGGAAGGGGGRGGSSLGGRGGGETGGGGGGGRIVSRTIVWQETCMLKLIRRYYSIFIQQMQFTQTFWCWIGFQG